MSYQQKFELVRESLITHYKERISALWGSNYFNMHLASDVGMDFGHAYINIFKEEFSEYMTSEIEMLLWFAGKNIAFSVSSFMSYREDAELEDVLDFTEKFLSEQLDDFDNWCDEIGIAMYEESSENQMDVEDRKEDDPS
jgi:hypothetical protein